MRPLTLRLQAFGSYGDALEIDFARLGLHGIFSITGPTGSGKSTIFDALVYALFDNLPGFRENGMVRSQYADPTTVTTVTLRFEVSGEIWEIVRSPEQTRPSSRSAKGFTTDLSKVSLRREGAEGALTKKGEVAARLEELIGLSQQQFEQVILIPQGKFEEVLKADTKDRAPLLRKLFPVSIYASVTECLRSVAAARSEELASASRAIDAHLGEVRAALTAVADQIPDGVDTSLTDSALDEESFGIASLGPLLSEAARLAGILADLEEDAGKTEAEASARLGEARAAAERFEAWERCRALAESFDAEIAEDARNDARLARARDLAALSAAVASWTEAHERLGVAIEQLEAHVKVVEGLGIEGLAATASAKAVAELAAQLDSKASGQRAAAALFGELVATQTELEATSARIAEDEDALSDETSVLEQRAEDLAVQESTLAALSESPVDVGEMERRRADAATALESAKRRDHLAIEIAALDRARAEALEKGDTTLRARDETRSAWLEGVAGRLAERLIPGEACPTCGSLEHPTPAILAEGAPSEGAWAAAEEAHEAASDELKKIETELTKASTAIEPFEGLEGTTVLAARLGQADAARTQARAAQAQISAWIASVAEEAAAIITARGLVSTTRAELSARRAALEERQIRFRQDRGHFIEAHGSFASPAGEAVVSTARARALRALAEALETHAALLATVAGLDQVLRPALAAHGVEGPAELAALIWSPESIEETERSLASRRERRTATNEFLAAYASDDAPTTRPDTDAVLVAFDGAKRRHLDIVGRLAVLASHHGVLSGALAVVGTHTSELEKTRRRANEASALAELCAGQGSGSVGTKVSLENWVLAHYLGHVLNQANARLAQMTEGRYELRRSVEAVDGRQQLGLDLSVFDATTGQVRSAKTLSGGETFMAALALALGLADAVSGESNLSLGALFIDEGFGSLDAQSLESVIDVLRSLQDGGRIVGVISHVEELRSALPSGITLSITPKGSRAEVLYPDD